jgi:hypothetical protein
MEKNILNRRKMKAVQVTILVCIVLAGSILQIRAQVCSNPEGVMYGLTGNGNIHSITINTGSVAAKTNPNYTGNAPNLSNAMGYNPVNGKFYYFKRNVMYSPQEFVSYDPAMNVVTTLTNSPIVSIINLGCVNPSGTGYYCIDAMGRLYYYRVAYNTWATICSNVKDQFGTSLSTIINKGASLGTSSRIYGDMAFDGSGNLWIVISGPTDFGVYKIPSSVPIGNVSSLTINQVVPPTTPSPGLESIGGVAFTATGEMVISTNAGDNKLYRLEKNLSLTYLSTMDVDAAGTDLTSCNFPMFALSESFKFSATNNSGDNVLLKWTADTDHKLKAFKIEHSSDGTSWKELVSIPINNAEMIENYEYVHRHTTSAKNYYRIVSLDHNNSQSYSKVKGVTVRGNKETHISLFPNPAVEVLHVVINDIPVSGKLTMLFYDQWGREIKVCSLQQGTNSVNVNLLPKGIYYTTIESGGIVLIKEKLLKL